MRSRLYDNKDLREQIEELKVELDEISKNNSSHLADIAVGSLSIVERRLKELRSKLCERHYKITKKE